AAEARVFGPYPELPVGGGQQGGNAVARLPVARVDGLRVGLELVAIIAVDAPVGANPDEAVVVLGHAHGIAVREALVDGDVLEAELARRGVLRVRGPPGHPQEQPQQPPSPPPTTQNSH
nr:hypothetical protein [Tanacetum cinerariifolium]